MCVCVLINLCFCADLFVFDLCDGRAASAASRFLPYFYHRAALTAGRSSYEKAVCPSIRPFVCLSVCPSVKRVDCDKTEERSVQIITPYERSFSLV